MKTLLKLLIIIIAFTCIGSVSYQETLYKIDGTIVQANGDKITVQDTRGHLWDYYGEGQEGDTVVLTLTDNHTTTARDDQVKGVNKR